MAFPTSAARPELPSRGELWSILLGALLASALLASAFRVTLFAGETLLEDGTLAASAAEPPRDVVVRHEVRGAPRPDPRAPEAAPEISPLR
jgi:hypothetical protein